MRSRLRRFIVFLPRTSSVLLYKDVVCPQQLVPMCKPGYFRSSCDIPGNFTGAALNFSRTPQQVPLQAGFCQLCDPKTCPAGHYLNGCGGFSLGTCASCTAGPGPARRTRASRR